MGKATDTGFAQELRNRHLNSRSEWNFCAGEDSAQKLKLRLDAQLIHGLNQATQVVAENLTKHFVGL
jgi:hypothetical protein